MRELFVGAKVWIWQRLGELLIAGGCSVWVAGAIGYQHETPTFRVYMLPRGGYSTEIKVDSINW
jgi:hypothetical protein